MPVDDSDPWSVTEKQLREALRTSGTEAAVATVISVEGSAYRRPGAKMLVTESGGHHGAVTAGCLESSVIDICADVIEQETVRTEQFDLTSDSDSWGLGLGCNGVIDLLVEPRDDSWNPVLSSLSNREPVTVVTVIESGPHTDVGDRLVLDGDGPHPVPDRNPIPTEFVERAAETAGELTDTGATRTIEVDGTTLLVDGMEPTPELLLFGSQSDLKPLVKLGGNAGFRVTVHSQRGHIDEASFPNADAIKTGHPTEISDGVDDNYTYPVLMSHNFLDDRLAVETLLRETDVPYIGLMGPRERFDRLCDALERDGVSLTEAELDRVAAPIGLDLGGGEPVEIALSIVSEIVAVRHGRRGGRLRSQSGPIHPSGRE